MIYYTVPRLGTGTPADPYRPDVPVGTKLVGDNNGTDYLIAIPDAVGDLPVRAGRTKQLPRAALEAAANARGRTFEDVSTWRVA